MFLACLCDYRSVLASGERAIVLCLAQNARTASVVFDYVCAIVESKPLLAKLVKAKLAETLSLTNGVDIEIRAASFRGLRGVTCAACVCDEVAFWYDAETGSANADSAILDAVRPALSTVNGLLVCISSPYARRGEAYATWSRHFGEKGDPRILVAQGAIARLQSEPSAKRRRPCDGTRPGGGERRISEGSSAAILRPSFPAKPLRRALIAVSSNDRRATAAQYVGFCDPSGGSADFLRGRGAASATTA